jgi:arsenical pump membrane protein
VSEALALALSLLALGATLTAAVIRPGWMPEAVAAVLGAGLLVAVGAISLSGARHALADLGPTVGFLAALLILAEGCRREGVFAAIGGWMAFASWGSPARLLALTFAACAAVTAVLGLDATVVLLTPVVFVTAARMRSTPRPHAYACTHLANSASLLLPVSNLTNLLAFQASRLSFAHFAALMALPWLGAIGVEWIGLRRFFARELTPRDPAAAAPDAPAVPRDAAAAAPDAPAVPRDSAAAAPDAPAVPRDSAAAAPPRFALVVLALTLAGFALSSVLGIAPVWFAAAGAVTITLPGLLRGTSGLLGVAAAAEPGFLLFVLGLGVIVAAAGANGLQTGVQTLLPGGGSLPDLLAIAGLSAVLANLVNNLPATLILTPAAAALGPGPVLAMLVGVNVGPNLTYAGSLATLLWRRVLRTEAAEAQLGEFTRLGLLTVPAGLLVATIGVWLSVGGWG